MRIVILLLIISITACQSTLPEKTSRLETVGLVNVKTVLQQDTVFSQNYDNYQPSNEEIAAFQQLQGKRLVVLFGAWCHDSQREVPRLLKLIKSSGVTLSSLQLVAVNQSKQDPDGIYRDYGLRYTPTIILLDGETELGRVIEKPQVSLGKDLAGFL